MGTPTQSILGVISECAHRNNSLPAMLVTGGLQKIQEDRNILGHDAHRTDSGP